MTPEQRIKQLEGENKALVIKNALLRDRPDMKVERTVAYREYSKHIDDLRTEIERLREDAERYRWLRDDDNWGCDNDEEQGIESFWSLLGEHSLSDFDEFIDERRVALATAPKENKE